MIRAPAIALLLLAASCVKPLPAGEIKLTGTAQQGGLMFGTAPPGSMALKLDDKPVRLAGDGRFLIGFGRDAPVAARITATLADGRTVTRDVAVAQRTYKVESIPGLRRPSTGPSAAYEAIRAPELAMMAAARAGETSETGWTQAFDWPAHGRISGVYGSQRVLGGVPGSPHFGVDVAAPAGTPVLAPAEGIVRFAQGPLSLEGNLVMLDHGHGLTSSFLHLSKIDVVPGERVERGQRLGAIGTTGRSTGPHVHWAMTWDDVRIDAATLVGAMPVPAASR
ncbi:M23 family metallopeptidase [Glacieibacterium sp.]|uniref:M23 family metallopeptidase n=1 Tax=Glacieibacterium sp. TaxID=2860237 RepID=UPI003B000D7C